MIHEIVQLSRKVADGYVISLGSLKLVCAVTDRGMVGCGAYDVSALDRHGYPAARVRSSTGGLIATVEDLLRGEVFEANSAARKLGIKEGMSGREALELL